MLEKDLQALEIFERRVLRTILSGVQEDDVWRRRMNHELVRLYGEPSIRKVAKAGSMRWAGHERLATSSSRPSDVAIYC